MYNWLNKSAIIITTILLISPISLSLASQTQEAIVKQVIDGNTIKLDTGEIVKYIGVVASSVEFNKNLVEDKKVRLEFDEKKINDEGHTLAYVYQDETFVNAKIIQSGYGSVYLVSPNTKFAEKFLNLEKEARSAKIGIWSETKAEVMFKPNETQEIPSLLDRILSLENEVRELKAKINELTEIINALKQANDDKTRTLLQKDTEKKTNSTLDKNSIVYVSIKAGKKYHKDGCRFLGEKIDSMTLEEAEKSGYEPCKICFPEYPGNNNSK